MTKVSESRMLIRFPDCDPMNHLNNARYLDYFIIAREDHLIKDHHFNIYEYAQTSGVSWVVGQSQIRYFRPAMLMEQIVVQSTLLKWGDRDLLVEMRMWDKEKKVLKALLWITFIHVNLKTQRSEMHSKELEERFRHLENPLTTMMDFEQRVEQVKGKTSEEV